MQVLARISQAFGIDLPLHTLFETPTVAGLAERIDVGQRHAHQQGSAPAAVSAASGVPPRWPESRSTQDPVESRH
jgi:hypothetical protein